MTESEFPVTSLWNQSYPYQVNFSFLTTSLTAKTPLLKKGIVLGGAPIGAWHECTVEVSVHLLKETETPQGQVVAISNTSVCIWVPSQVRRYSEQSKEDYPCPVHRTVRATLRKWQICRENWHTFTWLGWNNLSCSKVWLYQFYILQGTIYLF